MTKQAELSNTHTMPAAVASPDSTSTDKAVIKKTGAEMPLLVPGHKHDNEPPTGNAGGVPGRMPQRLPQSHVLHPHVDVSGKNPKTTTKTKEASRFALGDRYPLDDYLQVKLAATYFEENYKFLDPKDRREYCQNMVKRANELNIQVSDDARKYASEGYASEEEIKIALEARRMLLQDEVLLRGLDKLAHVRPTLAPDFFCAVLEEFDKKAGLNHYYDSDVPDPYWSTFGVEKNATFSELIGNQYVNEFDLHNLADKQLFLVKNVFTDDFALEFRKDPIGIYKSLPLAQRRILAHMASEQRAGTFGST